MSRWGKSLSRSLASAHGYVQLLIQNHRLAMYPILHSTIDNLLGLTINSLCGTTLMMLLIRIQWLLLLECAVRFRIHTHTHTGSVSDGCMLCCPTVAKRAFFFSFHTEPCSRQRPTPSLGAGTRPAVLNCLRHLHLSRVSAEETKFSSKHARS